MHEVLASFADLAQKDLAQVIAYGRERGTARSGTERCRDPMREVCGIGRKPEDDGGQNG